MKKILPSVCGFIGGKRMADMTWLNRGTWTFITYLETH